MKKLLAIFFVLLMPIIFSNNSIAQNKRKGKIAKTKSSVPIKRNADRGKKAKTGSSAPLKNADRKRANSPTPELTANNKKGIINNSYRDMNSYNDKYNPNNAMKLPSGRK